jgi:hypothetical protein
MQDTIELWTLVEIPFYGDEVKYVTVLDKGGVLEGGPALGPW